jgi:hypothetical protein
MRITSSPLATKASGSVISSRDSALLCFVPFASTGDRAPKWTRARALWARALN